MVLPLVFPVIDSEWVRETALRAGADDVGFVGIDRAEIADQRSSILILAPKTRTMVCFLCRFSRSRNPNGDPTHSDKVFRETAEKVDSVARELHSALKGRGIGAKIPAFAVPVSFEEHPVPLPMLDLKALSSQAGLGMVGIHQSLLHPKLGNFFLIGALLVEADVTIQSEPMTWNPCIDCYLCVPACPVGAIGKDGSFDSEICFNYAYSDFRKEHPEVSRDNPVLSGIKLKGSGGSSEAPGSVWPTLNCGDESNTAHCLAVCPVGEKIPRSRK